MQKKAFPVLYAEGGTIHREFDKDYIDIRKENYTNHHYHQVSDEYDDKWDFTGAIEDLNIYMTIGLELANNNDWPKWKNSSEFKPVWERKFKSLSCKR